MGAVQLDRGLRLQRATRAAILETLCGRSTDYAQEIAGNQAIGRLAGGCAAPSSDAMQLTRGDWGRVKARWSGEIVVSEGKVVRLSQLSASARRPHG